MRRLLAISLAGMGLCACGVPATSAPETPAANSTATVTEPVASSYDQYWTNIERVDRRTCADISCGVVGQFFFEKSAHVYEIADGWARVTARYDGSCVNGRSEYVDHGTAVCTDTNGFIDGKFAEWVELKGLSATRPAAPAASAAADETLVANSDDFALHRRPFAAAAAQLIADRRCTRDDFIEMGGWMKSVNQYKDQPVYFTYCGGMTSANKVYLDATTGRIFR